jgi:hypothetical protein
MEITESGIYDGVPMRAYIEDPCPEPSLSRGAIERLVMKTPAHAHHEHPRLGGGERSDNDATDRGSAAHAVLLGGEERIVWVEENGWRKKVAKEARDAARSAGQIPMLAKKRAPVESMVERACDFMRDLTGGVNGRAEHTVIWKIGGVWCRCRPDWFSSGVINTLALDYKTTEIQGGPEGFIKNMMGNGYDIGARWQERGLHAALRGQESRRFVFLVQEVFKPYCCYAVSLSSQMEEIADEKIAYGLKLWLRCREAKAWPGYNPAIHYAEPPAYAVFDWEARKAQLIGALEADS